jgi:hypothetical protein
MSVKNYTGRPLRLGAAQSTEIPSDGMVEFTTERVERDVLVLDDGREIPGVVEDLRSSAFQAPWGLHFPGQDDVIVVNGQVAKQMEAVGIKLDCQVWSPGKVETSPEGVVYAPRPVRHKGLTTVYRG